MEQVQADPRLLRLLKARPELLRVSGNNDLRELEQILDALEGGGQLPGDIGKLTKAARAELARLACAVVMLEAPNGSTATGFFVAPNLVMTNRHVLLDRYRAAAFRARLDYDRSDSPVVRCRLAPERFFKANADLDYAIVAVECPPARAFVSLAAAGKLRKGDSVLIVQYPNGGPRKVGIDDNEIRRVDERHVYYLTDTTEGSSGSPVFDRAMRIVALHHTGGVPQMSQYGVEYVENIGVRIDLVASLVLDEVLAFGGGG